jgi:hypothetical protein
MDGVAVDVPQLLDPLCCAENPEVVVTSLPEVAVV